MLHHYRLALARVRETDRVRVDHVNEVRLAVHETVLRASGMPLD